MLLSKKKSKMTKIGVFYDGNYFLHVSNYFNYSHPQRSRLDILGLHRYIKNIAAEKLGQKVEECHIVDSHYFRGRLSARDASNKGNQLYYDRVFDDILMNSGVNTHYLPIRGNNPSRTEKGIDVWLALEAYEQTSYKEFDLVVLIASDGDYVPLVRKLNGLGALVMLLSWDFSFINGQGEEVVTKTSQRLVEEASYPIPMLERINEELRLENPVAQNLFVQNEFSASPIEETRTELKPAAEEIPKEDNGQVLEESEILTLKEGFGFIKYPNNNLFFYHTDLLEIDFNELQVGDPVKFDVTTNNRGQHVAKNVKVLLDTEDIYEDED
ncbi:MAG: uncharacterized LabA/DUF88 family protein/cold shock CspA family protein [Luteibaculaceae bacterium]|jgi:uncharacterized LabA/DUF88 family protein/cold shock CspA family protein